MRIMKVWKLWNYAICLQGNLVKDMKIMKLLVDLNRKDKQTFVLVTHSEEIGSMANRIIRMSDGKIIDDGIKKRRKKHK